MRIRKNLADLVSAAALAPTLETTTAPGTWAASGCWCSGSGWWCNNVRGAAVYEPSETDGYPHAVVVVGCTYSSPSWFRCRRDDGPCIGGPHPDR